MWGNTLREYLIAMHQYDIVWLPDHPDDEIPWQENKMTNQLIEKLRGDHWLTFGQIDGDDEVTISYSKPFDLNDNKKVDDQIYRAGRRLKRRLGNHPCSKTPKLHLQNWSDSFDEWQFFKAHCK